MTKDKAMLIFCITALRCTQSKASHLKPVINVHQANAASSRYPIRAASDDCLEEPKS